MRRGWDAIVIGCGAMGAAACLSLARRGAQVLCLEQFSRGHDRGSSHGGSRVVRETYFESPLYVPLVRRSLEGFEELEELTGERLLHRCGVLYIGDPRGPVLQGVRGSADQHGIPVESLDAREIRRRFPAFAPADGAAGIWEPRAGFVRPERAIRAMLRVAEGHGAIVQEGERVEVMEEAARSVVVESDAGRYEGASVVIAGGAWTATISPALASLLRPTRQTLAWISPATPDAGDERRCPVWFIEDGERGAFYGIPTAADQDPPAGLKVARHLPGDTVDPDAPRSTVTEAERADLEAAMARLVPGAAGPAAATTTCLYTMTPDEHFIIDRVPEVRRACVACGFSGHGFKFAPVVGEILADLALDGRSRHPSEFLRLDRFDDRSVADPAEHP